MAAPTVTWLDPINPIEADPELAARAASHPMRLVVRAAAAEVGAWTPETMGAVARSFDELAGEWHTHHSEDRLVPVIDALTRGGPMPDHGIWLEPGCGDGWATATLAQRAPALVSMDLSWEMVRRVPPGDAAKVQADAAHLPLDDHSVTAMILMNMLVFPTEMDRVLVPGGVLVWLNSNAEATPIHLMPEQVAAAMPGRWGGVAARNGQAIWAVLRRQG